MICYFLITKLFHLTLFIYFKEEKKLSLPLVNSLFVLFTLYVVWGFHWKILCFDAIRVNWIVLSTWKLGGEYIDIRVFFF